MYRKKVTYSLFTIPFAVVSFNVYDWQRRRAVEKTHEVDQRVSRVTGEPVDIQTYYNPKNSNKFPWVGLNSRELNQQFAWRPVELNGQFDHSRQVLVEKIKDGEEGYDVITPFYCYSDENGQVQPVLVNRGWIPYDAADRNDHLLNAMGPMSIKGLVYLGESNKYSKHNQLRTGQFSTLLPEELATYMFLPNREVSSQFVVKQLEFNPINKSALPVVLNVNNLANFPISVEANQRYATFWKLFTFANIFSNMMIWIYL